VVPSEHLTYGNGPRGSPRLRKALSLFLNSRFKPIHPVTYGEIIVMSGVSSIIEAFAWSVCNEGEGILIPQPLYATYTMDIGQRSRGIVVPVPFRDIVGFSTFDDSFKPSILRAAFECALKNAEESGIKVRAVILSK
jgi:aspartate/methionine/tyrosine aminotransferase